MNFSSEIKFSNNLIKNGETYILYSGNLYKQNSEAVHIVYGFGNNWEHTIEKEMEKNSNGFVAKIKLLDYDKFNFCFKNQYNEWDNNNSSNYTAQIEENDNYENNFIINEGLLDNLIDGIFNSENITVTNDKETSTIATNITSLDGEINNAEITNQLDETSINTINNIKEPNDLDMVNLEKNTTIDESINTVINNEFAFNVENNNEITDINVTDTSINFDSQEDLIEEEKIDATTDIDTNINNIESSNNEFSAENDVTNNDNFNMDALINEILSPIVTSENLVEENIEPYSKESNTNIIEIFDESIDNEYNENDKHVDDVITSYLNDLYDNINTSSNSSNSSTISDTKNILTSNNTENSDYSELDRTISKFKQIQALQDLDNFFETPIINKSTTFENPIQPEEVEVKKFVPINTNQNIDLFENSKDEAQVLDEFEEESLIEKSLNNKENEKNISSSVYSDQNKNEETSLIISPRHVSPLYIAKKKIKISFLKIFKFIPRLLNKKINEE